ncbi:putative mucin TcMUCII [Trypanosoma cruzi]|uniref:Mucin TcMUCII, putative n=2 Tax=Trypanosoma cruzi TaxID=5693 RepID=Q4DMA9_TRYCC|nr:mucin TcMUCII, putative [Trypanosoma cruzi]EAN93658.1 mucin TcMUCII, putative [Trypanosoma cruzi]PWV11590.1 putative mucin TcMUCII [Trypanosoma cruzi]|eukprot:XP_815509.1 mucin TcMUCII [Trypanosoma cruzi strain CL Brener]
MMMTCRLLCALLVLALCCCPSVCVTVTADAGQDVPSVQTTPLQQPVLGASSSNPQTPTVLVTDSAGAAAQAGLVVAGGGSGKRTDTGKETGGVAGTPEIAGNSAEHPRSEKEKSQGTSSGSATVQNRDEKDTPGLKNSGGGEQTSGRTGDSGKGTDLGPALPDGSDTTSLELGTKQEPSGSGESGGSGGSANPVAQIGTVGSVSSQIQKENAPSTTTTTTTTAPEAPSTTTTTTTTTTAPEAPSTTTTTTTTTTRAPSRLRKIDGSFSSSAWVCAPLLLAVSALAYTAVG